MATTVLHRADTRGHANHGWLDTHHTFSFAGYQHPERVHFGALRVLNDDRVKGGYGFGEHGHDNMEIISIPLSGDLEHRDSMGNQTVIRQGDVQLMSAGTGVRHSEKNHHADREVQFLQIWVFPKERNITPRYDQQHFSPEARHNQLLPVVTPDGSAGVRIHQDAWFYLGNLDAGFQTTHALNNPANGLYIFVLEGEVRVNGRSLGRRDGLGLTDIEAIELSATTAAEVLLMEVPMQF